MQEEVENRTLTLVVSGTKFTGRLLKAAISKYMAHCKEKKLQKQRSRDAPVTPHGKQTVKQIIAGADIAITSWGVPQLDKEILDCAPNLRFVAHAAGSVKGIVSDELYARGIRVVSSARILSYGVSETALGLTICACKNVFAFNEEIRNGGWVEDYARWLEQVFSLD